MSQLCVKCNSVITTKEAFVNSVGGSVCKPCHEASKRACAGCANPILPNVLVTKKWQNKEYHTDCFRCASCSTSLKSFVEKDGKVYCAACSAICAKCNQLVGAGRTFELEDKKYHERCFSCSKCNLQLKEDQPLYVVNDKIVCGSCQ
eukprot:TRINITY_DN24163_c0_g1_i1.p1 TRINITY_DN24163_c0_g1~~TRINITY_DN24163_c0_g1_i1.p1  ORF type:complete len:147 (+),score=12.73 TRINITY_DN24163_c0_g1_i1:81-521(+)